MLLLKIPEADSMCWDGCALEKPLVINYSLNISCAVSKHFGILHDKCYYIRVNIPLRFMSEFLAVHQVTMLLAGIISVLFC